jgi:hypothetical protein
MGVVYKINGDAVSRKAFNTNPRGAGRVRMPYTPKHGFAIDFDSEGRPHFNSHRQQRAYLRKIGMHNRDAYFS